MSFSFCLNRNEVLILSGFGLLFQGLDLNREGKLIKDNQRLVCSVIELLERAFAPGAAEFKKVACSMLSIERFAKDSSPSTAALQQKPAIPMPAPRDTTKSARKQLQAIASRFSFSANRAAKQEPTAARRATVPKTGAENNIPAFARHNSQLSISSARSEPAIIYAARQRSVNPPTPSHSDSAMVVPGARQRTPAHREQQPIRMATTLEGPNLDYLPFGNDPVPTYPLTQRSNKASVSANEWERLLGSLDSGQSNIYDNIYGGSAAGSSSADMLPHHAPLDDGRFAWSPDAWGGGSELNILGPTKSVLSSSEESLTSGEDVSSCDQGGGGHGQGQEFRGITISHVDGFALEGLDGNFGL